jgi:uncharacterized protein YukE
MSESLKVVNPTEVAAYGTRINARVDEMFTELNGLCSDVVGVDYYGTNAFKFKTDAGQMAADFSKALAKSINDLKENVAKVTSSIAGSLGGSPITIDTSDNTLTPATPAADDGTQIANPTALSDLVTTVNSRIDALNAAIDGLKALPGNDRNGWMGDARNATEDYVGTWTESAKGKCEEARTGLVNFIDQQNTAVQTADAVAGA